jgi:N4-(beta-N-acetylglucosaminyl)-L-asparaginase
MPEPLILSTWSFGLRGNAAAWPALAAGGSALDAVETVCRVVELDEEVDSVGYGGLPDRAGTVSLDGAIMLSPARCGSICALRRHNHPVSIARSLMERTSTVMLAGEGADAFADQCGFGPATLLAPSAEQRWREWQKDPRIVDQSRDHGYAPPPEGGLPPERARDGSTHARSEGSASTGGGAHDTIAALALDADGVLAAACSSSGLPYKLPGRIGDSPIIGSGIYVDPAVGAAAATGHGELILGLCSSFLIVELMRGGASPLEAVTEALSRYEPNFELRDDHQAAVIALAPDGRWASGSLRPGYKTCITSAERSEVIDAEIVLIPG